MKMNIALVTYAIEVGGVETMLRTLATGLRDRGHDVCFVETQSKGEWSDRFRGEGWRVVTVAQQHWRSRVAHARRIADALLDTDVVLLHDAPYAQSVLGLLNADTVALPVLHNALKSMVANASANPSQWDALVGVSPSVCEAALSWGALHGERVRCIPNGVDVPAEWPKRDTVFHPARDHDPLRVVFIGRVEHNQKGVRHLPGIMRRVAETGVPAQLDVIGDGPDLPVLRDLTRDVAGVIRVDFHGALDHAPAMRRLRDAHALIMPSYFEGLPITLLETMALGVTPVVSKLPACTDYVVTDAADGRLIEPGDEEGFARALARLGAEPETRRAMSRAAWRTARERFSGEAMSADYLELIAEMRDAKRLTPTRRSNQILTDLLGDCPRLPLGAVRPWRKLKRLSGAA
ncbi:MAG: glycosyltransferase family 4 protein [Planctomycetota bacterium]|jgi:glycosyltransferase involved in cell wall biosynthesis